jgi:hypothetical protein
MPQDEKDGGKAKGEENQEITDAKPAEEKPQDDKDGKPAKVAKGKKKQSGPAKNKKEERIDQKPAKQSLIARVFCCCLKPLQESEPEPERERELTSESGMTIEEAKWRHYSTEAKEDLVKVYVDNHMGKPYQPPLFQSISVPPNFPDQVGINRKNFMKLSSEN